MKAHQAYMVIEVMEVLGHLDEQTAECCRDAISDIFEKHEEGQEQLRLEDAK